MIYVVCGLTVISTLYFTGWDGIFSMVSLSDLCNTLYKNLNSSSFMLPCEDIYPLARLINRSLLYIVLSSSSFV